MGLESPRSAYTKLKGADTITLTAELRRHGIKLLGSTIVGLEHHTPENIEARDRARRRARYRFPPVHAVHAGARHAALLRDEGAGAHAARRQPGRYPRPARVQFRSTRPSRAKDSKHWLDFAFRRDFERNGPSIYRICRTTLDGWRRYKNDADSRVRERFAREARALEQRLRRRALGHGAPPAPHQSRGRANRFAACARKSGASSACSAA